MGALYALTKPYNWYQNGTLTESEAADAFQDIIDDAYDLAQQSIECPVPYSAPFWDDAEGDDASTGEGNPEYPFFEDVANFAIAGFVLYAAGPGAALQYWTVAEQFRLAFRKHDVGGIIKIFLDGSLLQEVDTYAASPELAYFDVISTGSTLRLEVSSDVNPAVVGTPVVEIIRKRLWLEEIIGNTTRYNETTETFQTYDPATDTWYDNPGADPRSSPGNRLPPRTTGDVRCDAAANMTAQIKAMIDAYLTLLTIVAVVNAINLVVAIWFPAVGLLFRLIIALVEALALIGAVVIATEMTPAAYDQLQCILYQEIGDDGQVSAAQKSAILARIAAEMTTMQSTILSLVINTIGEVGLSNAGATGTEVGDCLDCPLTWCRFTQFNLFETDGWAGFAFPVTPYRNDDGTWISQKVSSAAYTNIERTWTTPCEIASVNFHIGMSDSYSASGSGVWIGYRIAGTWTYVTPNTYDPPVGISYLGYSTLTDDVTGIRFYSQVNNIDNISVYDVETHGIGENPFGETNC